jgi:hypothetical protein
VNTVRPKKYGAFELEFTAQCDGALRDCIRAGGRCDAVHDDSGGDTCGEVFEARAV